MTKRLDAIDLEDMVWDTLTDKATRLQYFYDINVDRKTLMQRFIDHIAEIPDQPEMSEAKAENRLENMRARIFSYEDDFYPLGVDKEVVKSKWENYNNIVEVHRKRKLVINTRFPTANAFVPEIATRKVCELSQNVTVFDATGDVVRGNAEALQKFVDEGRNLTVYAPENALSLVAQNAKQHTLNDQQIENLKHANLRALVTGDGNKGCYYQEESLLFWFRSMPALRYYTAAAGETIGNWFRENKQHEKHNQLADEKAKIPQIYYGWTGFCYEAETEKLQAKALKALTL